MKKSTKEVKSKRNVKHPYTRFLNEIKQIWKNNPENVKQRLAYMVEKKGNLLERPFLMEFIERFLGINKTKISTIRPELFEEVFGWVMRHRINYFVDVGMFFRIKEYQNRYWVNRSFQLEFIERELEIIRRTLTFNNGIVPFQEFKVNMVAKLKYGEFPDTRKYNPFWIGKVLILIKYSDFLKKEREKLQIREDFSTLKVPLELDFDNQKHKYFISIRIPSEILSIFDKSEKERSNEQIVSEDSINPPITYSKLLTRKETSEIMQVSLPTIDNMTKQGKLKCYRIGNTNLKRYKMEDINDLLLQIQTEIKLNTNGWNNRVSTLHR